MNRIFSGWARRAVWATITLMVVLGFNITTARAAVSPPAINSGTVLDGSKTPEKPAQASDDTALKVAESAPDVTASGTDQQRIRVNSIRFSGELPVAETVLQQVVAGQVGKELTLSDLNRIAAQLTHYLRGRGFLVALAYIPAQTIKDDRVEIAVVPGKYGAIVINNQACLGDGRVAKMAAMLQRGAVVTQTDLERVLLVVNDLPGVDVKASLAPGQEVGTTDLTLNIVDTAKFGGSLYADNWGNRYTGAVRGGVSSTLANPGHYGDALQIGAQTAGSGLRNFNLDYSLPLGYRGLRLAASYSRVEYTLGKEFASLDASGNAAVSGLNLSYPFRRSRGFNLYGTFGYNYKDLYDEYGTIDPTVKTDRLWNLGLNGNFSDRRQGLNSFSLVASLGRLSLDDTVDTSRTAGDFTKLLINYRREQQLGLLYSWDTRFSGQLSSKNLDSSEKFYLGGADGVRAYPQGEASCDLGILLSMEFKRVMRKWSNAANHFYLANFYDYASGQLNKELWNGAGITDNRRNLADTGLGLVWVRRNFNLRLDYALKLGGEDAEADINKGGRLWLQCIRHF